MSKRSKKYSFLMTVFCLLFTVAIISTTYTSNTSALTAAELREISQNRSYFYNGEATASTSFDFSCAPNTNYSGALVWTDSDIAAIEANQPFYEAAASQYGYPWQLLAVIHYQEHELLRSNPENGQGIYQLYTYTNGGKNENRFEPTGSSSVSDDEFQRQTNIAAGIVNNMAAGLDLNTDNGIKKLFYNYNSGGYSQIYHDKAIALGFSEEQAAIGEGSPYVMNRYDTKRDPANLSTMDPNWRGVFVDDKVYDENAVSYRFGTFVRFKALLSDTTCVSSNDTIANTALSISKSGYVAGDTTPSPAYEAAMKATGNWQKPNGIQPEGASCDQFVSTVMRFSGSDPDFPTFGPLVQKAHMESHPEMYQLVDHQFDINNLQEGDIFVAGDSNWRHILIYTLVDGVPGQAAASYGNRTGQHFKGIYFTERGYTYSVYRRINQ